MKRCTTPVGVCLETGGKRGFVAVQISDGVLQPYGRVLGIKLRLHENVVIHRVQTIAESNHRSRLCLLAMGNSLSIAASSLLTSSRRAKSQPPTFLFFPIVSGESRTRPALLPAYCDTE